MMTGPSEGSPGLMIMLGNRRRKRDRERERVVEFSIGGSMISDRPISWNC